MPTVPSSLELRAALSVGAEIGLAKALSAGAHSESVADFIEARLQGLSADDLTYIKDLAQAMRDAAAALNAAGPDDTEVSQEIPINGDLFGDEPGGRRTFWGGEWNVPGSDEWFSFSGSSPGLPGPYELAIEAARVAAGYIGESPERFKMEFGITDIPTTINVRFTMVERKY